MAGIVSISLSASGEGSNNALRLSNGEIARGLTIGANWTELAIGMRVRFNGTSTFSANNLLRFGVCSGPAGFVSPVSHSIYAEWQLPYSHYGGSENSFIRGSGQIDLVRNYNDSKSTIINDSWTNDFHIPDPNSAAVVTIILVLSRSQGSNHWDYGVVYPEATSGSVKQGDNELITLDDLEFAMEQATGGNAVVTQVADIAVGLETRAGGSSNFARVSDTSSEADASATYGDLNNIFLHWNRSSPELDIADIVVAKYA